MGDLVDPEDFNKYIQDAEQSIDDLCSHWADHLPGCFTLDKDVDQLSNADRAKLLLKKRVALRSFIIDMRSVSDYAAIVSKLNEADIKKLTKTKFNNIQGNTYWTWGGAQDSPNALYLKRLKDLRNHVTHRKMLEVTIDPGQKVYTCELFNGATDATRSNSKNLEVGACGLFTFVLDQVEQRIQTQKMTDRLRDIYGTLSDRNKEVLKAQAGYGR